MGSTSGSADAGNLGAALFEVFEREFMHRSADASAIDGIKPDLARLPLRVHDGEDEAGDDAIELHHVHSPV